MNRRAVAGSRCPTMKDGISFVSASMAIHVHTSPHITFRPSRPSLRLHVPLLGIRRKPKFHRPECRPQGKGHQGLVHVVRAGRSEVHQKLCNRVFGYAGHANRRTDRTAFNQRANHLNLLVDWKLVHTFNYKTAHAKGQVEKTSQNVSTEDQEALIGRLLMERTKARRQSALLWSEISGTSILLGNISGNVGGKNPEMEIVLAKIEETPKARQSLEKTARSNSRTESV